MSEETKEPITNHIPRVITRVEPIVPSKVLGEYKCTGKGGTLPDRNQPTAKPCGSAMELTLDCVYKVDREIQQGRSVDEIRFTCPVCNWETVIDTPSDFPIWYIKKKEDFPV